MVAMQPTPSARSPLMIVLLTVLIDTIGLGIIIPVIPKLVMELSAKPIAEAAVWGGWLGFAYAFTQFFFSPIIGGLSDRFGRRPVILASLLAFGLDYIIMGFAPTLLWLFIGRVVAGISGASFSTANAYIADITAPEKRAARFGLIGAMFGIGFILGPTIGGLLGAYGPRVPFFAAGGLALLNAIYAYVALPESLPPESRRSFRIRRANVLGTVVQLSRYPGVLGILASLIFYQLAHQAYPSTWSYYTMAKFGWDERAVGLSLGFFGICMAIVQGGLAARLIPVFGEFNAVIFGFSIYAIGYAGIALAPSGWVLYLVIAATCIGGIGYPAWNGLISKQIPGDAQGELQGAIASSMSLTSVVGPPIMTHVFQFFSSAAAPFLLPGASFALSAVLSLLAATTFALAAWAYRPREFHGERESEPAAA